MQGKPQPNIKQHATVLILGGVEHHRRILATALCDATKANDITIFACVLNSAHSLSSLQIHCARTAALRSVDIATSLPTRSDTGCHSNTIGGYPRRHNIYSRLAIT
jgi:hypothetical protein